jgi:hypothetical protein
MINWQEAFNRLFEIINTKNGNENAPYYIDGSSFIKLISVVDYSLPRQYSAYIQSRRDSAQSTSRHIWYKELLDSLPEDKRREAYLKIIETIEKHNLPQVTALKAVLGVSIEIPRLEVRVSDPKMEQEAYLNALSIINNNLKSLEQKKSFYSLMGEEAIRDHVISDLENRFQHVTATRESLNKEGKTDILLKYTDQTNLFVAECKFWTGPAGLLATVDQLLGYLTWRDSKAAVVVFVDNVNFSNVLKSIKNTIPTHPNFVRHIKDSSISSFSYIFNFPGDPHKEFQLEIMAYHFPN